MAFFDFLNPIISILTGNPSVPTKIVPTGDNKAVIRGTTPSSLGGMPNPIAKKQPSSMDLLLAPRSNVAPFGAMNPKTFDEVLKQQQGMTPSASNYSANGGLNPFDYSDIEALIAQLGGGGYDSAGAMADLQSAYRPALRSLKKQKRQTRRRGKRNEQDINDIYKMLAQDMRKTKQGIGDRYDKYNERDTEAYNKSVADVNSRYDADLANQLASLQRQNAPEEAIAELTNQINTQRNRVLDNLLQGNTARSTASGEREQAQKEYYRANIGGAKLRGNDAVVNLRDNVQDRLNALNDTRNKLLAQRAGDRASIRQQAASASGNAAQAQLSALMQLRNLQRTDAESAAELLNSKTETSKPLTQSQLNQMNVPQRAQYNINSLGISGAGAQMLMNKFLAFMNSDADLSNGQYYPEGSDKAVKMNVQTALKKYNAWADANGLSASEKQTLRGVILNTYR